MSIWASTFGIEDERQWTADLEEQGIATGIIRDGAPSFDDLDAPIIYMGSHVLPEEWHDRGGSVDLAVVPPHVRFWRENPDADPDDEPEAPSTPCEPFLRLSVDAHRNSYDGEAHATVILTKRQAVRLRDALQEFIYETDPKE